MGDPAEWDRGQQGATELLEVFDIAWHAQHMESLSLYRSEKPFRYALRINLGVEGIPEGMENGRCL